MPKTGGRAADASVDQLKEQLAAAIAAASDAYRHTSRLIRVLTVLGQPSSPAELVEQTLFVLSQVYSADVIVTARVVGGGLQLTGACGVPEGDPAYLSGWPLVGAAAEAVATGRTVARAGAGLDLAVDVPDTLAGLTLGSAVWVPVGEADAAEELLIMFRANAEPFPPTDLQVLGSVASRLRLAVQARRRSASAERLATFGHRLASRLDLAALYAEAARLLPLLLDSDDGGVMTVQDGWATLAATAGDPPPAGGLRLPAPRLWGWSVVARGAAYTGVHDPADPANDGARVRPGAVLAVPVLREGVPAAVLYALRNDRRPFLTDAVESATIFANYVGAAMTNAELYRALGQSETSLRLITDSISDLIAVVDAGGRFVYVSPSHDRELSLTTGSLLGSTVTGLAHPEDRDTVAAALADPGRTPKVEYRLRAGRDAWVWVESAMRPVPADGTVVLSSRVIDERRRLEEELRRRATHDPLTELANRSLTAERLEAALADPDPSHVGLLFCDLDKFKEVNDRLGHEAGDELLTHVADRLRGCVRRDDLLARFGGDEFVVVLDGVADLAGVREIGDRVVQALEAPFMLRGERVDISVSVGGVLGVRGQAGATAMLRDADAAMYAAKNAGRGRVEVFDDDASHRSLDRLELRSELTQALARGELSLRYQPIVELGSGQVTGFEALCRWRHPRRGMVPPDVFIPLAEETGAIIGIGEWVLGQACRQLAEWQREPGGDRLRISVNLSATQLHQPDAAARTLEVIQGAGVRPGDVWLEITEHSSIRTDVTEFATALRAAGVHFALDDFGISYSNLSHLKRLPVEILKIDRSFVAGLTAKDADRGIVRAVLAIADSLGLSVVAEGIETAEQRIELMALGCHQGQGYLFSRPVPADEARALLATPLPHPPADRAVALVN
jgi:diguanylate cyclase (GGDEF)-like protein/PAS domain S-box-containing protein